MGKTAPYRAHLRGKDDLVTTYEEIRAGFVALALERNRRATPYVEQARSLKTSASQAKAPADLSKIKDIQIALLTAAGVSDKAASHMLAEDKKEAIEGLIRNFLEPAGSAFVEELVFRFLLTRGDTLGGSMRNVGGVLAQRRLIRAIITILALSRIPFSWLHLSSSAWIGAKDFGEADIELNARGLCWRSRKGYRTLMCNLRAPLVRNNIDLCLLDCNHDRLSEACRNPELYLALAELKGGIDPAGADEHWKTARTALSRVKAAFAGNQLSPKTFYIGAAIAKKMAEEIWNQLEAGALDNAANLTNAGQTDSLCRWLTNL